MQGPGTLHFLIDEQKRSYYIDSGGNLQVSAAPKPLTFAPDGWQKSSIENNRNSKYFGIDRSLTIPLSFVEDGAKILKTLYYTKGDLAKCYLLIFQQKLLFNDTEYGYYYKALPKLAVDWNNFNHAGTKVTVNFIEDGLLKFIKANESTVYEFPLDVPDMKMVQMDGIAFTYRSKILSSGSVTDNATSGFFTTYYTIPVQTLDKETSDAFLSIVDQPIFEKASPLPVHEQYRWLIANTNLNIEIEVNLNFTISKNDASAASTFRIVYEKNNAAVSPIHSISLPSGSFTQTYNLSITVPLSLAKDNKIALLAEISTGTKPANFNAKTILTINESFSYVKYKKAFDTTYAKSLSPAHLFNELVKKMTGGSFTGLSDLLERMHNYRIMSGDALRGIENSVIKISFANFFQSINSWRNVGLRNYETKLELAEKRNIIYDADPIYIGSASSLKITPATNYKYNKFKFGYNDFDYEDVNGKDEFNCSFSFSLAESMLNKELDLTSVIRGDCYGAEFTRLNLEGKTTTDGTSDNDTFVVVCDEATVTDSNGTYYTIKRTENQFMEGSINRDTIFNLDISPRRNMLRHGYWLRSLFFNQDSDFLQFNSAAKNSKLVKFINSIKVLQENASVRIGDFEAAITVPVLFEFDIPVPDDFAELIGDNPARILSFTYNGMLFYGIHEKTVSSTDDQAKQTFTLLALASNDFTQLIDVYE